MTISRKLFFVLLAFATMAVSHQLLAMDPPKDSTRQREECFICCSGNFVQVVAPCGHQTCLSCAYNIIGDGFQAVHDDGTSSGRTHKCPYCRRIVEQEEFQAMVLTMPKEYLFEINTPKALVHYIRSLSQSNKTEIAEIFSTLQDESMLKMALRLVYAQDHQRDLVDDANLNCVDFINNISYFVNNKYYRGKTTKLFSQDYLQYVLPLLEPLFGPVTCLNLEHYYQLTELPAQIGTLINLQYLNLGKNKLTRLPAEIGNLVNLQVLTLFKNQITELPIQIGNLVNLQVLWLAKNQITQIPAEVGNLINLQRLSLVKNQLSELPLQIGNLVNLQEFRLQGNKFPDPIKSGLEAHFKHLGYEFQI